MSDQQSTYRFLVHPQGNTRAAGGGSSVYSEKSSHPDDQSPDLLATDVLSIALIGPDEERRRMVADALARCQGVEIREYSSCPPNLDDVLRLLEQDDDVIIIDLDSNPEYALDLVESICANGSATVMLYSMLADPVLLVRSMHAGAREFLTLPLAQNTLVEALVRASARRSETRRRKKAGGRLQVFMGAKGGDGATTLATNFAVAIVMESKQSALLIDLDLPLGDVALNLGITGEYSTISALQNSGRLDASFLSSMVVKHSSGISVLAAPGKFPQFKASNEAIDRLIEVALRNFDNVIVDIGCRIDLMDTVLFKGSATIYLILQASIAGLRNANRMITQLFSARVSQLQIVINRFEPRVQGVTEEQIAAALTRPVQWKIPNDYAAVRRMHQTAVPLVQKDSSLSRQIRRMARSACGLSATEKSVHIARKDSSAASDKKAGFSLKSLLPKFLSKESAPEVSLGTLLATKTETPLTRIGVAEHTEVADVKPGESQGISSSNRQDEPEGLADKDAASVTVAESDLPETRSLDASEETVTIAWPTPVSIPYGVALSGAQLNATASAPGTFIYTPAADEVLAAGTHTLRVAFTPADSTEGDTIDAEVMLVVTKATPVITWPTPAPISSGTALSAAELNATAPVPGRFVYIPAAGAVLAAGTHTPSVLFTPLDTANYTTAQASISLVVTKMTPVITWPTPAPISCGAALSAAELNATASVPGRFIYTPAIGEVLAAGTHTLLVAFTPNDTMDYEAVQATVSLTVDGAQAVTIVWPTPAAISYGTALSSAQLNARAPVSGTFVYTPAAGTVLAAGTQTLSVAFTPTETTDHTVVRATVSIVVEGLPNTASSIPVNDDRDGDNTKPAQMEWEGVMHLQTVNRT